MNKISLALAGHDQLSALSKMAAEIWWDTYPSIISKEQISFMLARGYSETSMAEQVDFFGQKLYFILDELGAKVGFVSVLQCQLDNESFLYVRKLYVATDRQGHGIGRGVLLRLREMAVALGIFKIRLNVNRKNPAYHFYKEVGFSVLREENIAYGPYLLEDYLMQWAW